VGELSDILQALEPSLGRLGGEPVPLEGGITNRNFRVTLGDDEYVVRLHGKDTDLLGISRLAERIANEAAAALGLAPEVVAGFDGGLVTRFVSCESLQGPEILERASEIALALRSFHHSQAQLPVEFHVPELLRAYAEIVRSRGGRLPDQYEQAMEIAARIAGALPEQALRPCHNDLLAGNLIRSKGDGRTLIVDWEYAGMGRSSFDLGNLAVNNDFDEAAQQMLLRSYYGTDPSPAQLAELKLMRVLSDVREAAWGVMQAVVSDLDFDFDGYADLHFARMRDAAESEAFTEWLAVAGA
jgi:thiamine kinase-like enzyme